MSLYSKYCVIVINGFGKKFLLQNICQLRFIDSIIKWDLQILREIY